MLRTWNVAFEGSPIPVDSIPFAVAALEVVVNSIVMYSLHAHPFHWPWLMNVGGLLTLVKHSLIYAGFAAGALSAIVLALGRGAPARKLE